MQCCYPSAKLGTVYHHVVAVNSVSSQDARSHGANSMSSCPFSPPAHSSSPPADEMDHRTQSVWTIRAGLPSSCMQLPQHYCILMRCITQDRRWSKKSQMARNTASISNRLICKFNWFGDLVPRSLQKPGTQLEGKCCKVNPPYSTIFADDQKRKLPQSLSCYSL